MKNNARSGGADLAAGAQSGALSDNQILQTAEDILRRRIERMGELTNPMAAEQFLRMRLGHLLHEEFHAIWLDNRHRIISVEALFRGTIDGASVYPREILRRAIANNAAAVIFAHNHPSGIPEPSSADTSITGQVKQILDAIGVRVLDHIVVGADSAVSMASRGLV